MFKIFVILTLIKFKETRVMRVIFKTSFKQKKDTWTKLYRHRFAESLPVSVFMSVYIMTEGRLAHFSSFKVNENRNYFTRHSH
jgi:hypothetical protein